MTDLDAANRALILIGVEPVGSLSDHSKAARTMAGLLEHTKKTVLNEFPWTFANRIVPLTRASGSVAGYSYAFTKPADALNISRVYGSDDFKSPAESRVVGNLIGANVASGSVEYTAYVADLDSWPQQIQECLVTRLASDAATSMTGNAQLSIALLQKYTALANHAAQTSVNEENIPTIRASDYINTRTQGQAQTN